MQSFLQISSCDYKNTHASQESLRVKDEQTHLKMDGREVDTIKILRRLTAATQEYFAYEVLNCMGVHAPKYGFGDGFVLQQKIKYDLRDFSFEGKNDNPHSQVKVNLNTQSLVKNNRTYRLDSSFYLAEIGQLIVCDTDVLECIPVFEGARLLYFVIDKELAGFESIDRKILTRSYQNICSRFSLTEEQKLKIAYDLILLHEKLIDKIFLNTQVMIPNILGSVRSALHTACKNNVANLLGVLNYSKEELIEFKDREQKREGLANCVLERLPSHSSLFFLKDVIKARLIDDLRGPIYHDDVMRYLLGEESEENLVNAILSKEMEQCDAYLESLVMRELVDHVINYINMHCISSRGLVNSSLQAYTAVFLHNSFSSFNLKDLKEDLLSFIETKNPQPLLIRLDFSTANLQTYFHLHPPIDLISEKPIHLLNDDEKIELMINHFQHYLESLTARIRKNSLSEDKSIRARFIYDWEELNNIREYSKEKINFFSLALKYNLSKNFDEQLENIFTEARHSCRNYEDRYFLLNQEFNILNSYRKTIKLILPENFKQQLRISFLNHEDTQFYIGVKESVWHITAVGILQEVQKAVLAAIKDEDKNYNLKIKLDTLTWGKGQLQFNFRDRQSTIQFLAFVQERFQLKSLVKAYYL